MPGIDRMTLTISIALRFQRLQVVAVNLDRKLAFHAADRFFHVVGNGLREVPQRAGDLLQFPVHGRDQLFLVLAEHRTPLILGFQIDEVFGVEEAGRIGAVVRAARPAKPLA